MEVSGSLPSPKQTVYAIPEAKSFQTSEAWDMKGLLKVAISVVMLWLVFRRADIDELRQTVMSVPAWLAVAVIAGYAASLALNSCKWWLIARGAGIQAPYTKALRASFVGAFANLMGLGTLSGDVLRGLLLTAGSGKKAEGIASVLTDRLVGLAVLLLIGLVSTLFVRHEQLPSSVMALLSLIAAGIAVGWFVGPWFVLRYFPRGNRFRQKVESMMRVFPRSPSALLPVIGVAVVFHLSQITLAWFIGRQLSAQVTYAKMIANVPFVNILSTLPISWNGVGVREKAIVAFFCPDVFSEEQVLTFGAIWLLGLFGSSLLGGLVAVLTGDFRIVMSGKADAAGAESEPTAEI